MNPLILAQEIIDGRRITREDDLSFFLTCDLDELCEGADRIREACIGDKVDLCSIINGRSGRCPEDCKYCAQSAHHHTSCAKVSGFILLSPPYVIKLYWNQKGTGSRPDEHVWQ